MPKQNALSQFASHLISQLILVGIGMILWGILFILWPASFVYLVSVFFIALGVTSLIYAARLRKAKREVEKMLGSWGKKLGM